jgi:hypothetical protein
MDEEVDDLDLDYGEPTPGEGKPTPPLRIRHQIRNLVFIVHGIRDYGFWTRKLAVRLKQRARQHGDPCRTVTSTYGFFPMGPFLLKSERRRRVGWLMDQYVNARAAYPDADTICFVGHSNGTYLLARALLDCPAVRFDRIVFAGSVVSPDYPWDVRAADGQIKRILNYVATNDWVVASVPVGLQALRFPDLGGAGYGGFQPPSSDVVQVKYVPGSHSAALREEYWEEIADFVLYGIDPSSDLPTDSRGPIASAGSATVGGSNWARITVRNPVSGHSYDCPTAAHHNLASLGNWNAGLALCIDVPCGPVGRH